MTLPRGQQERGEYERSLVEAAAARKQRLYGKPDRPRLTLVPRPEPEPEPEEQPLPTVSTKLRVLSIVEEGCIVPAGRFLSPKHAQKVMESFCEGTGVTLSKALGNCRTRDVVSVRRACWSHLEAQGYSLAAIGRAYGWDHTTVRFGVIKFREAIKA